MKLIKTIKLHRELRIKQEVLCNDVSMYSQTEGLRTNKKCPELTEFIIVNKAVRNIEKKLPNIYFILSDLFGGCSSLHKLSKEAIRKHNKYGINQP